VSEAFTLSPCPQNFDPMSIDRWFPLEQQRQYVSRLVGQIGLTRRRAEYFVRLWGYLWLKQQVAWGRSIDPPLSHLDFPDGFVSCTHREAAALFYADRERGSTRAAGMMLDKLADLGLIAKQFDGNTICIQIEALPQLDGLSEDPTQISVRADDFNPRTDAIPVASFLAANYNWMNDNTASPHHIARQLRCWARQYPSGSRVLRRCDNLNPIGFYVLYPTAAVSEKHFFLPPGQSLHLMSVRESGMESHRADDPFVMANPGDLSCTSVFVRSWALDRTYLQPSIVCHLIEDTRATLERMQRDFPNLCDLYALGYHPVYEKIARTVGFQRTSQDSTISIFWLYMSIDRLLELDIAEIADRLTF